MVQSGKIIPSDSSWASPVRLVAKPDGGVRLTVDYKQLNIYTKKVAYPLPLIDEIFQRLSKAVYFTVLDLTSAYNQVSIHPMQQLSHNFIRRFTILQTNIITTSNI
jgi:hypothetical protein